MHKAGSTENPPVMSATTSYVRNGWLIWYQAIVALNFSCTVKMCQFGTLVNHMSHTQQTQSTLLRLSLSLRRALRRRPEYYLRGRTNASTAPTEKGSFCCRASLIEGRIGFAAFDVPVHGTGHLLPGGVIRDITPRDHYNSLVFVARALLNTRAPTHVLFLLASFLFFDYCYVPMHIFKNALWSNFSIVGPRIALFLNLYQQ